MAFVDLLIIAAILASIVVGAVRGVAREAIAITTLVVAIWAALRVGHYAGGWLGDSIGPTEVNLWIARFLVFIVILALGGLTGWGMTKIIRLASLTGVDRSLGGVFGLLRAGLLIGLFVLLGRYAAFDGENWWLESRLIPYAESVADWIEVMAPIGMEMLQPEDMFDDFQLNISDLH